MAKRVRHSQCRYNNQRKQRQSEHAAGGGVAGFEATGLAYYRDRWSQQTEQVGRLRSVGRGQGAGANRHRPVFIPDTPTVFVPETQEVSQLYTLVGAGADVHSGNSGAVATSSLWLCPARHPPLSHGAALQWLEARQKKKLKRKKLDQEEEQEKEQEQEQRQAVGGREQKRSARQHCSAHCSAKKNVPTQQGQGGQQLSAQSSCASSSSAAASAAAAASPSAASAASTSVVSPSRRPPKHPVTATVAQSLSPAVTGMPSPPDSPAVSLETLLRRSKKADYVPLVSQLTPPSPTQRPVHVTGAGGGRWVTSVAHPEDVRTTLGVAKAVKTSQRYALAHQSDSSKNSEFQSPSHPSSQSRSKTPPSQDSPCSTTASESGGVGTQLNAQRRRQQHKRRMLSRQAVAAGGGLSAGGSTGMRHDQAVAHSGEEQLTLLSVEVLCETNLRGANTGGKAMLPDPQCDAVIAICYTVQVIGNMCMNSNVALRCSCLPVCLRYVNNCRREVVGRVEQLLLNSRQTRLLTKMLVIVPIQLQVPVPVPRPVPVPMPVLVPAPLPLPLPLPLPEPLPVPQQVPLPVPLPVPVRVKSTVVFPVLAMVQGWVMD